MPETKMAERSRQPFECARSSFIVVERENIDTDQIIPGRFLTTTERAGLGQYLFYDWRYDKDGRPRADSIFNGPEAAEARVLVAGRNFGCGSSREHAPWALSDFGFRAVLSPDFADIFRANALKNGLLPVTIDEGVYRWLVENPEARVSINLESQKLHYGEMGLASFSVEPFARWCLMNGSDELDYLMAQEQHITAYEAALT